MFIIIISYLVTGSFQIARTSPDWLQNKPISHPVQHNMSHVTDLPSLLIAARFLTDPVAVKTFYRHVCSSQGGVSGARGLLMRNTRAPCNACTYQHHHSANTHLLSSAVTPHLRSVQCWNWPKITGGSDGKMFEILHRDWNFKPIFTQKWTSVDMNWEGVQPPQASTASSGNSNPGSVSLALVACSTTCSGAGYWCRYLDVWHGLCVCLSVALVSRAKTAETQSGAFDSCGPKEPYMRPIY